MALQFFDQCEAQAKSNALLSVFSFMLPRYNSLIAFFSNKKKQVFSSPLDTMLLPCMTIIMLVSSSVSEIDFIAPL